MFMLMIINLLNLDLLDPSLITGMLFEFNLDSDEVIDIIPYHI